MKKNTQKAFFIALVFSCVTFAQTKGKQSISKSTNAITQTNQNQLSYNDFTEDNKRSFDETGYVKCTSVEMHERRMLREGNSQSNDAFEEWLAPQIEARKQLWAQQKANGTFKMAVTTIPIIFHIITDGAGAENLSAAQIQAQIDQLNLDFSNQAGSTSPVAADAMVQFIPAIVDPMGNVLPEPGIDRITTFGDGPFPTSDFDVGDGGLEIKSTVWDRSQYANIWTADISGGILGYAQFPSNSTLPGFNVNGGTAQNDGVVIGYGTAGSVAVPGTAAPYNLGRTLTHEIGHWIGLRHIWGDGGCTVDDFCNDTPESDAANYGTGGATSCGTTDMVENYMDYTDDSIMNIFTTDQVARIATVVSVADGFVDLVNSTTGGVPTPTVVFTSSASASSSEGSDCTYTDVTRTVSLNTAASALTTVDFTVNNGGTTATNGVDYQLITNSVSFAAGVTGTRDMIIRVFHDGFVEGDETVQVDFSVTTTGDATAGTGNSSSLIIADDDLAPISTQVVSLLSSDFEAADTTNWFLIDADGTAANDWSGFNGLTYTGIDGSFIGSLSSNVLGNGANYSPDNYLLSDAMVIPANASNVNFTYGIGGYQDSEPFEVYWTTDNTDDASILAGTLIDSGNSGDGSGEIRNINLTTIAGQTGYLVFRHFSQGNGPARTSGILLLDNVGVNVTIPTFIQTAINNGTTNDQLNLSGTGTVYTDDTSSGDVMLDITNNDSFDYSCTTSAVSRAGTGAQAYNGSTAPNLAMDKVFNITPSNTTTTGDTTVKFYFELAEITGWEGVTSQSRNDLVAYKESTGDVVPLTVGAFGTDITLTGNFSGLDGDFYFGTTATFAKVSVSPKVYLQGAAINPNTGEESLMRDDLRVAGIIPTTSPYADALMCNAAVFTATGANAIVDWVFVELRDETTNTTVLYSQSALLQRDGDVVGVDGISPLTFDSANRNFYIAIKHRNHLGVMTSSPLALTSSPATVDFTNSASQITFGSNAQTAYGMSSGIVAMWSGDANGDAVVQYTGATADSPGILTNALNDVGNFLNFPTFTVNGYSSFDVNMDGGSQYTGASADSPFILQNALNHPGNFLNFTTYSITAQLP